MDSGGGSLDGSLHLIVAVSDGVNIKVWLDGVWTFDHTLVVCHTTTLKIFYIYFSLLKNNVIIRKLYLSFK